MELTGLHLLLTYRCTQECDHCFVWGAPDQTGTMTLDSLQHILAEAQSRASIRWIYFEGGEPCLYYPILVAGVARAQALGFKTGMVTNAYWATGLKDALEWLKPLAGKLQDLSISTDLYHDRDQGNRMRENARVAAELLGIPCGFIVIPQPEEPDSAGSLVYRGRAVEKLSGRARTRPWSEFTVCSPEDLRAPGRVHVDALGFVHICQGITIGNLFQQSLTEICTTYDPDRHPVTAPLLAGGPAELIRRYRLPHADTYADACHLCYSARLALRDRLGDVLGPDQMYGGTIS